MDLLCHPFGHPVSRSFVLDMLLPLVMFQSPVLFHKDGMGYPVYCLVRLILDHRKATFLLILLPLSASLLQMLC